MTPRLTPQSWSGLLDQTMKPVPISKAKAELSRLVARACAGVEVVIARGKRPLVRLVPVERPLPRRQFGALRGAVHLDRGFFDPLPDDELARWAGGADED
jgi:antitoxin (DNA-binding transcriptional repressor) of toxin-antitoxin stability system